MKNSLKSFLAVVLFPLVLTACYETEEFNHSISLTNIDIPELELETPGTDVTIKGDGFREGDGLLLRPLNTSVENQGDIKVKVLDVSSDHLTFHYPATATNNGYALVLVRQGDLDLVIGVMRSYEERGWIKDVNLRNALKATFPAVFDAQDSVVITRAAKAEAVDGTLNVSGKGIKSMLGIGYFPRIKTLWFTDNSLGKVDLRGCEDLTAIFCWGSNITEWVIDNPNLVSVYAGSNPYTSIDLSKAPKVSNLVIDNVPLRHLNISTQKYFDFGNFKFAFTDNKEVQRTLYVNHTFFVNNDLAEKATAVRTAGLDGVVVSTYNDDGSVNVPVVDFGKPDLPDPKGATVAIPDANFRKALKASYAYMFNDKDEMYIEAANKLTGELNVSGKGINNMSGLEHFIKITTLHCTDNGISTLDLSGCQSLEAVFCWNSGIQNLLVKNSKLITVYAGTNQIKNLDLTKAPNIQNIVMDNVPFLTLDIRSNKKVDILGNCNFSFTQDASKERVLKISHQLFTDKDLLNKESLVSKAGKMGVKVITYNDDGSVNINGVVFP
nr:hypothetical protein [uncultured Bacteroides sp.]